MRNYDFIFRGTLIKNLSGINQDVANIAIIEYPLNATPKAKLFKSKNSALKYYKSFKREFRKNYLFVYCRNNQYWYLCYSENDFRLEFCYTVDKDKIMFVNN